MQIKEIKIASFQTNEQKICLTYQWIKKKNITERRYIIRINRKIIKKYPTNELWDEFIHRQSLNDLKGYVYDACNQTKLNI